MLKPISISLAVQRLRTLQEKKEAQAKSSRRDIATLLEKGRLETARIKVENSCVSICLLPEPLQSLFLQVINEDIYVELLELLELHCELIIARFGLLDQK
jgi:vacuolar protein sorting-associated protein IST1